VRVTSKSVSKSVLPTLMRVETGKKFLEGNEAPTIREIGEKLKARVRQFVNMDWDPKLYDVTAAYIIATFYYDLFSVFPRMFLFGPYGSGKTRLGLVIGYASYHGLPIIDPSDASSYCLVEAVGPTLYIDESVLTPRIIKIVAAGYKRGLGVPRVEKAGRNEAFIIKLFSNFAPVCMGYTELPPEIILQRCILIVMKKAPDPNPERRDPEPGDFEDVREELYLARLTGVGEVIEAMRKVREELGEEAPFREFELWYPLLTIAYLMGEEAYKNVKKAFPRT